MTDKTFYCPKVLHRHNILFRVSEGHISLKQASAELSLSYRHTKRLFKRFIEADRSMAALVFKKNHSPAHKLDLSIKNKVIAFYHKHPNLNNYHLADLLEPIIQKQLHPSTVRAILIQAGVYPVTRPRKRRARKRFEREFFGQLVQMDTSQHKWLSTSKRDLYLVLMLDDHSRAILAARIFEHDTTWNNMLLIREAVEKYGLFEVLYTDNDSKFKLIRTGFSRHFEYRTDLEKVQTEIHRALLELGITLLHHPPKQPQCKGKIERIFGFLQDRFIKQAAHCPTLKELNNYLQRWIHWYNYKRQHYITGVTPSERMSKSVCRPLPAGLNLDDVFCFKQDRIVKLDNTFALGSKTYQITNFKLKPTWAKTKIRLHILPGKCIRVFYQGQFIQKFALK
jgi:transposase InsO family protein